MRHGQARAVLHRLCHVGRHLVTHPELPQPLVFLQHDLRCRTPCAITEPIGILPSRIPCGFESCFEIKTADATVNRLPASLARFPISKDNLVQAVSR
jgi:hypothetical protein